MVSVAFGGWSGLDGNGNWAEVPSTIPVMIFSLVYHDLAPGNYTILYLYILFRIPNLISILRMVKMIIVSH